MCLSWPTLKSQDPAFPLWSTDICRIISIYTLVSLSFVFSRPVLKGPSERPQNNWRNHRHSPWLEKTLRRRVRPRPLAQTVLPGRPSAGRTQHLEPSTWFLHPLRARKTKDKRKSRWGMAQITDSCKEIHIFYLYRVWVGGFLVDALHQLVADATLVPITGSWRRISKIDLEVVGNRGRLWTMDGIILQDLCQVLLIIYTLGPPHSLDILKGYSRQSRSGHPLDMSTESLFFTNVKTLC